MNLNKEPKRLIQRNLLLQAGALIFLCLEISWAGPAAVVVLKGHAERLLPGSSDWAPIELGERLPEGTGITTSEDSYIDLDLDQGHRLHITAGAHIILSALQNTKTKTYVKKGKILSKVRPLKPAEDFLIQTPSAVCAVRGTEFWTGVTERGTAVEVYKGMVGMQAPGGKSELMVRAGESAGILKDGSMIPPHTQPTKGASDSPLARAARHEVGLDMDRNEVMAAAAAEIRLAEYREGKSLVDVQGNRVRLEEYIMRPQPNEFKFVVLNERNDRLDYFFYHGTFNQTLPTDLSIALRDLSGRFGSTAPDYYLTSYEMGQSNTQDSVHDTATGGHLVNITIDSNGDYVLTDPTDPSNTRTVTGTEDNGNGTYDVYNPLADAFSTVTADQLSESTRFGVYVPETQTFQNLGEGDTYWQTRFNSYTHALNDVTKINSVQSVATNVLSAQFDRSWVYAGGTMSNPVVTTDPNGIDATITRYYGDGTFESYRTVLIDDNGKVAPQSAFAGISTGAEYKNELLKWNYEQQVSASEFEGRKIDLVVEPKIFINSGLIP